MTNGSTNSRINPVATAPGTDPSRCHAAVKQHLTKPRKIVCRRKKSGMTRDSTHAKGSRVVNLSAEYLLARLFIAIKTSSQIAALALYVFGWGKFWARAVHTEDNALVEIISTVDEIRSLGNSQLACNIFNPKLIEFLTADSSNNFA